MVNSTHVLKQVGHFHSRADIVDNISSLWELNLCFAAIYLSHTLDTMSSNWYVRTSTTHNVVNSPKSQLVHYILYGFPGINGWFENVRTHKTFFCSWFCSLILGNTREIELCAFQYWAVHSNIEQFQCVCVGICIFIYICDSKDICICSRDEIVCIPI